MKPLLAAAVAICLVLTSYAHPENIEEVKELPQNHETLLEAEESEPQARKERCTTCFSGNLKLNLKSPNEVLSAIQAIPGAEVHTQQSFEGCSSDKGCAGLKVKDGRVVERFGNTDAFKAAAAADTSNEFQFHAAGALGNVFEGGIPANGPFWWMNENSPFKNGGGNFEKFSKSSSSFSSTGGAGAAGFGVGGNVDISANPFLNGEFSKTGFAASTGSEAVKPGGFQSSSFGSSFSSSSKGDVDLTKNPFLNGGVKFGQGGFAAQGGFGASGSGGQGAFGQAGQSQSSFTSQSNSFGSAGGNTGSAFGSSGKFGATGYTGSSPSPFTASSGSNVNTIQSTQKVSEFDFDQQQQTQHNVDEAFQSTGNVHAHEHSGGELQQTCAGQGYVCVHKAQCNNGVVNTNGAGVLQAKTQKQYCNIKTEICCRVEVPAVGAGSLQGSLGVGSATYSGSSNQGSGLFATGTRGNFGAQGNFGQTGQANFGTNTFGTSFGSKAFGQGTQTQDTFGQGSQAQGSFGQGTQSQGAFGQGTQSQSAFGQGTQSQSAFGQGTQSQSAFGQGTQSQSAFGQGTQSQNAFGQGTQSQSAFGQGTQIQSAFGQGTPSRSAFGQGTQTLNAFEQGTQSQSAFGQGTQTQVAFGQGTQSQSGFGQGPRGQGTVRQGSFGQGSNVGFSASASFGGGSANRGTTGVTGFESGYNSNKFASSSGSSSFGAGASSRVPATVGTTFNSGVYKSTSQSNFIDNDSFSAGSEYNGVYRPGASGTGLKPGIPYLPPVDNVNQPTIISSTAIPVYTTPRPVIVPRPITTPRPVYVSTSTAAPGYLPPQISDSSNTKETRVPRPNYIEGGLILDQSIQPAPKPLALPSEIPAGCAAALKCTPIEYCTAEGMISNTTIVLTRDQEIFRVPLTDCKDLESGRIGKCCRDPYYTDPWPTNQLGRWVPGVFGGNDGQYVPDSRGAGNNPRGSTVSPPVTGNVILNNYRNPTPTPFVATQVTSGFGQKGQYEVRGQGQYTEQGQGSYAVKGQGQATVQGAGAQGQYAQGGIGFGVTTGQGQAVSQGFGTGVRQGFGQAVVSGQGQAVQQGFGSGIRQGFGQAIVQGEGQASASEQVYRVILGKYEGTGECGVLNGQKPYGNRNDLEVDFAEIAWQAMVLLQTNKSLLCGGVITRPDVVLTSASCVEGLDAKNVLIKGGEWKLGIDDEPLPFQIVQVKHILRHPFYKAGSYKNDVAVLVLTENLRLANNIYPICLPGEAETLDAFYNGAGECIVTGWGKQVLQAHLAGSIMHSLNVSLINPGECQSKLSTDYPHLLEQYDQESCACGQPLNPVNNICKVDIGSALACTTDNRHYVLRGVYSWDSGCQAGNQLAAFYKFDLEWYQWAIGLIESVRFAKYAVGTKVITNRYSGQLNSAGSGGFNTGASFNSGGSFKSGASYNGVKSATASAHASTGAVKGFDFSQFGQTTGGFGAQIKGPLSNSFSASYSEKKVFQSEPQIITYTTKPEIVTFTTKPEYFTYTTKPKIVTFTTKPQIITYETSGSGTNPQYVAPGVTFNPDFTDITSLHKHNAQCKCLENGKK